MTALKRTHNQDTSVMPDSNVALVPAGLPAPEPEARAHLRAVENYLIERIKASKDGFMPFDEWMHQALYAPGLGYYAAGNTKFGADMPVGDFTTAPELSPLFGQVLARQIAQVLTASQSTNVLEFGAGSGSLAASIIPALRKLGLNPNYQILEVSADLRARQQARLADFAECLTWLEALPESFEGCVVANEVLDAMPAIVFHWHEDGGLMEKGVGISPEHAAPSLIEASPFQMRERPANADLQEVVLQRMPPLPGYQSEVNMQAEAWVRQVGTWLKRGAALLIDYGFPQREYYHPQRATGTLMCHFRHHAHSEPLVYAGLQDITTHIDFTAMADAALDGGLEVLGYTTQARFLMNAGLADALSGLDPTQAQEYAAVVGPVQKLVSESEMGELFKVLAIGRGIDEPLLGFTSGDRRHRL